MKPNCLLAKVKLWLQILQIQSDNFIDEEYEQSPDDYFQAFHFQINNQKSIMKKFLFLSVLFLSISLLFSCDLSKQDSSDNSNSPKPKITNPDTNVVIDSDIIIPNSDIIPPKSDFPYAPGSDVIGFGYDVFGEFASPRSIKPKCLFKFDYQDKVINTKKYQVPDILKVSDINENTTETVYGKGKREFARNFSADLGLDGKTLFFKGSIDASYNLNTTSSESTFYFTSRNRIRRWKAELSSSLVKDLKRRLDPEFVKDLENPDIKPELLFEKYGTH